MTLKESAGTRVLLALAESGKVKKGDLMKRVKREGETSSDYASVLESLVVEHAIRKEASENKRTQLFSLDPQGMQRLGTSLQESSLNFEDLAGGNWIAPALFKIIHEATLAPTVPQITSYEEFKEEALTTFEKLNKGYNYAGLVPIWHIRQEFGDRVDRLNFNDWMLQMQAERLFYLQQGGASNVTDLQERDSISTELRGLLFYASYPV
jgi:hypothetical protein